MQYNTKMSDMASFEANNTETAKLLLCYVLYKISKPVEATQLYEITVKSGVINYFYYNDAIASLLENECIIKETDSENEVYSLSQKGIVLSKNFKSYIPKSFRDRLVTSAIKYFNDIKIRNEFSLKSTELENGYSVEFSCFDGKIKLMDLKMYAPDAAQSELIMSKIRLNPIGFYSEVLGYVISNTEEEIQLDEDN